MAVPSIFHVKGKKPMLERTERNRTSIMSQSITHAVLFLLCGRMVHGWEGVVVWMQNSGLQPRVIDIIMI